MSRTTTALVVTDIKGPFELRKVCLDSIRPDEALVEIHASSVCYTDISSAPSTPGSVLGAVLGHEGSRVVLEVGLAVTTVSKGDEVFLSFSYCKTCRPCLSGYPAYCYDFNERNFGC